MKSTMPPVVEPMVWGRHRALPGQAQGLAQHGFLVEVGVVLVAAFDLFIPEHQGHLIAGQGVEAAVTYQGLGLTGAGDHDASLKLSHLAPPVMI